MSKQTGVTLYNIREFLTWRCQWLGQTWEYLVVSKITLVHIHSSMANSVTYPWTCFNTCMKHSVQKLTIHQQPFTIFKKQSYPTPVTSSQKGEKGWWGLWQWQKNRHPATHQRVCLMLSQTTPNKTHTSIPRIYKIWCLLRCYLSATLILRGNLQQQHQYSWSLPFHLVLLHISLSSIPRLHQQKTQISVRRAW